MDKSTNRTLRQRYVASQMASPAQVDLIKKIFLNIGREAKSKLDYSMLTYYEANGVIKSLKVIQAKQKRTKKRQCKR